MPASTVLSQYTFTNLGPLTTTFTAPAACYTPTNIGLAPELIPDAVKYESTCSSQGYHAGSCVPEGTLMDDNFAATTAAYVQYYSPGLMCPDLWTTVGVAAREGESFSSTGLFAPTVFITRPPTQNPSWNVAMENLDNNETAVACCPSGYTAAWYGGRCYSNLPVSLYTATTGCIYLGNSPPSTATFVYNGSTVTGYQAAPDGAYTTAIETLEESELETLTGVTVMPMLTMYHRAEDAQGASSPTAAASSSSSPSPPPPGQTNAAKKFDIMGGDGTMGAMVTVWASVAVLGAILFGAAS